MFEQHQPYFQLVTTIYRENLGIREDTEKVALKAWKVFNDIDDNPLLSEEDKTTAKTAIIQCALKGVADIEDVKMQFNEACPRMLDSLFWTEFKRNINNGIQMPFTTFINHLYRKRLVTV